MSTNKTIRLKTTPGSNKNINISLKQEFDTLEVLSLKLSQEDLYKPYCSDYGVVVGRVIINKGFGVPNAKISVFIPISSEDERNELIKDLYPYKTPYDKNKDGVRYNLLLNKNNCDLVNPVGTFPTKEELLDNDIMIEIFDKYYKYTTKTNNSGDFMLFGVPLGDKTVHVDVDMSDMGIFSVRPYELITEGYNEKLFKSRLEYKKSNNLDTLAQIKSQNIGVNVIPFWGDPDNCEIGITRVDFDLNVNVTPTSVFTGSLFTDTGKNSINRRCNPRNDMGKQCELTTKSGKIRGLKLVEDSLGNPMYIDDVTLPDGGNVIDENGVWAFDLPMYQKPVVTDEYGNITPSNDPDVGIFTTGKYRFLITMDDQPRSKKARKRRTASYIVPSLGQQVGGTPESSDGTEKQRFSYEISDYGDIQKDFQEFTFKQVYTIANYISKYKKGSNRFSFIGIKDVDECGDKNYFPFTTAMIKRSISFFFITLGLRINHMFLKLLIVLINFQISIYFKLFLKLSLRVATITVFEFCEKFTIKPFQFLTKLIPNIKLECSKNEFQISTDCGDATTKTCAEKFPDSGNDLKFGFDTYIASSDSTSPDYCPSLNKLESWLCCAISDAAVEEKAIRYMFTDSWLVGSLYHFQFKYKSKEKNDGTFKEKGCFVGSDNRGGDNYKNGKCSESCLVRAPYKGSSYYLSQLSSITSGDNSDGNYMNWNPKVVNPNGADDIDDLIYCNRMFPTKIVNLGSLELCKDVLDDVYNCIQNPNCNINPFEPLTNKGFDVTPWSEVLPESTYETPEDVTIWMLEQTPNCNFGDLFRNGGGCREYELTDSNQSIFGDVSKIQNDITTVPYTYPPLLGSTSGSTYAIDVLNNSGQPLTNPPGPYDVDKAEENLFVTNSSDGPFNVNTLLNTKYNPVPKPTTPTGLPEYSDRGDNTQESRGNTPYFYFGLIPGKTAIDKVVKQYFKI